MADKSKPLPPVPAPISIAGTPIPQGQRVSMPMPQAKTPVRSVFDVPPVSVATARKKAEDTRRALAGALQGLRNAADLVKAAQQSAASDPDTANILAMEGLTPGALQEFADLSAPLLKAFTAA